MLIRFSHHRRWIGFTLALLLAALGVYLGLSQNPQSEPRPILGGAGVAGIALVVIGAIFAGLAMSVRRKTEQRPGHRSQAPMTVLCYLAFAIGLSILGFHLGTRWARPGGPVGNSVAGMWYGIVGYACMVFAGLLSALRRVPAWWWLGTRSWWLKGHIWLGLLSVPLILFHSGCRWGGALEIVLWVLLILTVLSGVLGLVLQQILPNLITRQIANEVPYEQIPHLCNMLRQKADEFVHTCVGSSPNGAPQLDGPQGELRRTYEGVVRPFLAPAYNPASPLARPLQAAMIFQGLRSLRGLEKYQTQLTDLETLCKDRQQMGEQQRLHEWLHWWLFAHIPLSVVLLALGAVHAVISLYY